MVIEKYLGIDRTRARQLIAATNRMINERCGYNAFQNTKVFLFDDYAVLHMQHIRFRNVSTPDESLSHLEHLAEILLRLQAGGIQAVPILAFQSDGGDGYIIQPRAKGAELYERDRVTDKAYILARVQTLSAAPQTHFDKFVADTVRLVDASVLIDFSGKDNFFYHEATGFHFIDLNAHDDYVYGLSDVKPQGQQVAVYGCFSPCYFDAMPRHRDTVSALLSSLSKDESALLTAHNQRIFAKCGAAMRHNGIPAAMIDEAVSSEWFIPQKHLLQLV